jgi:hypothetical protein
MQKNLSHVLNEISGESKLERLRLIGYDPLDEDQDRAHGLVNAILQQKFHSLTTLKLPFVIPSREDLHKLLLFPALANLSIGVNESLVVSGYHASRLLAALDSPHLRHIFLNSSLWHQNCADFPYTTSHRSCSDMRMQVSFSHRGQISYVWSNRLVYVALSNHILSLE